MIQKALQWIAEQTKAEILTNNGFPYSTKPLQMLADPKVTPINIQTLSGLVDYLAANLKITRAIGEAKPVTSSIDGIDQDKMYIHVETETSVALLSSLDNQRERQQYIQAFACLQDHRFNVFRPLEEFMIYLQTHFVQTDAMRALQAVVGNISDGAKITVKDDGVTQETTVKNGIIFVENAEVPNPVELAPYRTFPEIEQPVSKFVFRIRKMMQLEAALFEADGGAWRNEAIARIAEYLRAKGVKPTVLA